MNDNARTCNACVLLTGSTIIQRFLWRWKLIDGDCDCDDFFSEENKKEWISQKHASVLIGTVTFFLLVMRKQQTNDEERSVCYTTRTVKPSP